MLNREEREVIARQLEQFFAAYIHGAGSVGAMVELGCETDFVSKNEEFMKLAYDIAMHVAALRPKFLSQKDVTDEDKAKAKAFFAEEVEKTMAGKPEAIKEKALQGKLDVYFKEMVLLDQPYVKNGDVTIGDLVKGAVQKFGENTEIIRFTRFAVGK